MHWYIDGFKNFGNFEGRARRQEYWMFMLFNYLVMIAISLMEILLPFLAFLRLIYGLAVIIPDLSVTIRRLHDTGKTGWYYLVLLIPIVGFFWLLILLCTDSDLDNNQYGPNPKNKAMSY